MLSAKSQPGDKPAGLIYVVVYTKDRQPNAAVFTHREVADAFCQSRAATSSEADCTMIETVIDGTAGGGPTGD